MMAAPETELKARLDQAIAAGNYSDIAKYSKALDKLRAEQQEQAKHEEQEYEHNTCQHITSIITKALASIIESGKLDNAQGVWFNWDFNKDKPSTLLHKQIARPKTRIIRHPGIRTVDLIRQYGHLECEDGVTYSERYFANPDNNFRQLHIRSKLLKVAGYK